MLAAEVLVHPGSRQAQRKLQLLEGETRVEQLCGLEAMAQIAASQPQFRTDRTIAYAMAEVKFVKGAIVADGAAFRSEERWYRLKFRCRISTDGRSIQSFEFLVGSAIPKSEWERHGLFAGE